MERESQIETTELTDEELETVNGGAFRFIRAIFYSGTGTSGDGTGTNPQAWVTSAT
jgi:bacteriocin-like protein